MALACKFVQKKNAFVINHETISIMEEKFPGIERAIEYDGQGIYKLDSIEMGHFGNIARENDVVGFEVVGECKECPFGINLWCMGDQEKASKRVKIISETEIFTLPTHDDVLFFDDIDDTIEFIKEHSSDGWLEKNVTFEGNTITIKTKYGDAKGTLNNCYIICHAHDSMQLLTLGTPSLENYYIFYAHESDVTRIIRKANFPADVKINKIKFTKSKNIYNDNNLKNRYKDL